VVPSGRHTTGRLCANWNPPPPPMVEENLDGTETEVGEDVG
jgi:hypothetical protein